MRKAYRVVVWEVTCCLKLIITVSSSWTNKYSHTRPTPHYQPPLWSPSMQWHSHNQSWQVPKLQDLEWLLWMDTVETEVKSKRVSCLLLRNYRLQCNCNDCQRIYCQGVWRIANIKKLITKLPSPEKLTSAILGLARVTEAKNVLLPAFGTPTNATSATILRTNLSFFRSPLQ